MNKQNKRLKKNRINKFVQEKLEKNKREKKVQSFVLLLKIYFR